MNWLNAVLKSFQCSSVICKEKQIEKRNVFKTANDKSIKREIVIAVKLFDKNDIKKS